MKPSFGERPKAAFRYAAFFRDWDVQYWTSERCVELFEQAYAAMCMMGSNLSMHAHVTHHEHFDVFESRYEFEEVNATLVAMTAASHTTTYKSPNNEGKMLAIPAKYTDRGSFRLYFIDNGTGSLFCTRTSAPEEYVLGETYRLGGTLAAWTMRMLTDPETRKRSGSIGDNAPLPFIRRNMLHERLLEQCEPMFIPRMAEATRWLQVRHGPNKQHVFVPELTNVRRYSATSDLVAQMRARLADYD